jgi:serine protease Do
MPSVVALRMARSAETLSGYERFFYHPFLPFSRASGVLISEDGLVITNAHVVRGAGAVTAELHTGEQLPATVLGADARSDIAALRVEGNGPFQWIEMAPPGSVRTGDRVLAVGSPFGLPNTVTAGIVSHPSRYLPPGIALGIPEAQRYDVYYGRLIQTDTALNRGNSGGALVDTRGRLVGMNVLIYGSAFGGNLGVGFAIPIEKLQRIVPLLAAGREISYGYLGVKIGTLSPELAEALGLPGERGVLINHVEPGTPAHTADIRPGEVVLSADGSRVAHEGELIERVGAAGPGEEIELEVASPGDRRRTVTVRLGTRVPPDATDGGEAPEDEPEAWRGLVFEAAEGGVRVARVLSESPGARAGIAPGMRVSEVIVAGERVKVGSVEEIEAAVRGVEGPVAFRTDSAGYLAVPAR